MLSALDITVFLCTCKPLGTNHPLLELYRAGGLTCKVVEYAVYAFDLVYYTSHDFIQNCIWYLGCICSHKIGGIYGTENDGVVVGAEVAHDADGTHVGKGGEVLAEPFVESGARDLVAVDEIGVLNYSNLIGGYFADYADPKAGAGEGLAEDHIVGDAEFKTCFSDFVFKEHSKRFDDLFEIYHTWKAADIVMGFYYR